MGDNLPVEGNFQSRIINRMGVRETDPLLQHCLLHLTSLYRYLYVLLCLYTNGLKDNPQSRHSKTSGFLSGDVAPDEPIFGILSVVISFGQAFYLSVLRYI